eukprot:7731081-Pyramimonas_sp.AAC.1
MRPTKGAQGDEGRLAERAPRDGAMLPRAEAQDQERQAGRAGEDPVLAGYDDERRGGPPQGHPRGAGGAGGRENDRRGSPRRPGEGGSEASGSCEVVTAAASGSSEVVTAAASGSCEVVTAPVVETQGQVLLRVASEMGVTRGIRGLSPTRPARLAPDLDARSSDSIEQASRSRS